MPRRTPAGGPVRVAAEWKARRLALEGVGRVMNIQDAYVERRDAASTARACRGLSLQWGMHPQG